jgi:hypothetical protein
MSREMEYYRQFGAVSCSDAGDRPSFAEADESGISDTGDKPGIFDLGDKPGHSDVEEEADAAGG